MQLNISRAKLLGVKKINTEPFLNVVYFLSIYVSFFGIVLTAARLSSKQVLFRRFLCHIIRQNKRIDEFLRDIRLFPNFTAVLGHFTLGS